MARPIPQSELNAILLVISQQDGGTSLDDLLTSEHIQLPRRTLQRRLAHLVATGHIALDGRTTAARYHISHEADHKHIVAEPTSYDDERISLGRAALAIQRMVLAPLHQRKPVGYRREFLDAYQPNVTHYLPSKVREHLGAIGRATVIDQPVGTHARQILDRLLIDLSWNSSRLEGNTYSLLETQRLVKMGEQASGKDVEEAQMIINHKNAIEFLVDDVVNAQFDRHTIRSLHALLSDNLLGDQSACGRVRSIAVNISGSVFHPLEGPQRVDECFDQLLQTADAIDDPFEQSFFVMVHLPYLQPFEDVNKRVSRLAANIPLIRHNLSPLTFVDVPPKIYVDALLGVYELNRVELLRDVFVWAYDRSSARYSALRQSLGDPDPFRLRHRALIIETIGTIVRDRLDAIAAGVLIRARATEELPMADRNRFIEMIETELLALHEGNFARYKVRPSEFASWRKQWDS